MVGFGLVWEAVNLSSGNKVALKVIRWHNSYTLRDAVQEVQIYETVDALLFFSYSTSLVCVQELFAYFNVLLVLGYGKRVW